MNVKGDGERGKEKEKERERRHTIMDASWIGH